MLFRSGDQSRQDAEWAQQSGLRKKTLGDMTAAEQMLAARPAEIAQQFGQTKQKGLAEIHRQAANALGMSHNIGDAGGTGAMVQSGLNAGVAGANYITQQDQLQQQAVQDAQDAYQSLLSANNQKRKEIGTDFADETAQDAAMQEWLDNNQHLYYHYFESNDQNRLARDIEKKLESVSSPVVRAKWLNIANQYRHGKRIYND